MATADERSKRIEELKVILEKDHGRTFTWEEAVDAADSLDRLAHLLFDIWQEDMRRKKKLAESPKGFGLDGGYTCSICGNGAPAGGNWYDKYGIKCLICQKAIDRKEIPGSLAKNKDSWYSKYDLERAFNVKGPTLKRWIKEGVLKARTVTRDGQGIHVQLFLIKDNKDTLPPKKLVESQMVKETKDGKDWYRSEPWYRFFDPQEHLKGYKIMNYLKVTHGEGEEIRKKEI
jgi:hypothetical protein